MMMGGKSDRLFVEKIKCKAKTVLCFFLFRLTQKVRVSDYVWASSAG
jgi:hypothetical protein